MGREVRKHHIDHSTPGSGKGSDFAKPKLETKNRAPEEPQVCSDSQNRLEEFECIEKIQREIQKKPEDPASSHEEKTDSQNTRETEIIDGHEYHVAYVPMESIYPAFGYSLGNKAVVREDLPPRVKRFVRAHELYHCRDRATWGGWLGREIRASIIPGLKDPIGFALTAWKTLTDVDRIKFCLKRIKEGR